MEIFACGNCGGALEVENKKEVITCLYCGYVNDPAALNDSLEEFKKEVSSWLTNLGAVGGSGMDVGMRTIYFRDNVYPSLCTEFSNVIGDTEDVLDLPLFYLQVYNMIPDLKVTTNWTPKQGKPLKELSRKLERPELKDFTPDEDSQRKLNELRLNSLIAPMLMDVIELASSPSGENLIHCANTLEKLASETSKMCCSESVDGEMQDYNKYYEILSKRFELSSKAFSTFAETSSNFSQVDEKWFESSVSALTDLHDSVMNLGNLSVTNRVLLASGLENDINAIKAGTDLVNLYSSITKGSFNAYVEAVTKFAGKTLFKVLTNESVDNSWFTFGIESAKFSWFLSALNINARREFYRVLVERDALGTWIRKQGADTRFFLYPFYVSKINTVLKSGFLLWKKGEEEQFFSLCDGAFNLSEGFANGDYPSLMTPGFKKMLGSAKEESIKSLLTSDAVKKPGPWTALPPSVSPSDVKAIYSAAHNFLEEADLAAVEGYPIQIPSSYKKMGFDSGKVKALSAEVIDLVFLPMALTSSGPMLMGKHLGLEEGLSHRTELCNAYDEFLNQMKT